MHTHRMKFIIGIFSLVLLVTLFGMAGCSAAQAPVMQNYTVTDFETVHSAVADKANKYLVLGNLQEAVPTSKLPPELSVFLGRWEGFSFAPPIKKDRKVVLVIQNITLQGGWGVFWSGTNLQYPDLIGDVHFKVVQGQTPSIQWQINWPDGSKSIETYTYNAKKGMLEGWSNFPVDNHNNGPYELTHDENFFIYKDYPQFLAGKRIYATEYQNSQLKQYGPGYLYYLPEAYGLDSFKKWPLIIFLHGYGDRGSNIFALANASPFMYIRDQGTLPFIIVAPLLGVNSNNTFPNEYMDGVLAEAETNYRIDTSRIYVTGLSMGGEATWRFAVHQPNTFAAIAPLSAYLDQPELGMLKNIVNLPVWAIHGTEDTLVPLEFGQEPVDTLKALGGNVRFTALTGHDHDVWTDTYSDLGFYDWLLDQRKP